MYRLTRYSAALLSFGLFSPSLWAQSPASPTFLDLHVGGTLSLTGTGAVKLNTGTTAQRPDSGNAGEVRYNSDTGRYEFGIGGSWADLFSTTTPTGGTTARSNADLAGDFVRATSFGAKFDGVRVASGSSMTAGSAVLNWSGGSFTAADVGKLVSVDGAGLNGRPLVTTITGYTSASQVTLNTTALSTVSTSILTAGYQGGPTVSAAGTGYAPGDLITLTGGTATYQGVLQVVGTKAVSATVVAGGSGGTTGACTLTGTTGNSNGTTTLFQATGTVSGGAISGALTVTVAGEYRDNPTDITAEPVTSNCGLVGTTVALTMGVVDTLVRQPGAYSVRPSDPIAQGSTTGVGTGATFTGVWNNTGSFNYGTNNGTFVQAAINYCQTQVVNNAGGCTVLLPIGTGLTSTGLTVNKSNVSLYSLSRSTGFQLRNVAGAVNETFPTRLLYAGADNLGYMLTQVPLLADGHRLAGVDVVGIMFDCNSTQGCGGLSIRSTAFSTYKAATNEPYPRVYTISGAVSAGTRTVVLTSATGVDVGQNVWIPNALSGTYVESISGNTITLSSNVYGTGLADGTSIYIGGEAVRVDVLGGLAIADTQSNEFWVYGRTTNSPGPCLTINGSALPGSPQFGNVSGNHFRDVACVTGAGDTVDANNSDHNWWDAFSTTFVPNTFSVGAAFVANGSLNANNGSSRYNWFRTTPGRRAVIYRGTSFGGFTGASVSNRAEWVIASAVPQLIVDTAGGASVCAFQDSVPSIGCLGTEGIIAQVPDSTIVGGNTRGGYAVDLQTIRNNALQVASGNHSVVGGGENNTASGPESVVPGGNSNAASGVASNATGISTLSDLYAVTCHGSGVISSGRHAQVCTQVLRQLSGTNTTPVRLTADGAAAGAANCVNSLLAGQIYNMVVRLSAVDSTAPANTYAYTQPMGVLTRTTSSAASTAYAAGTPTTAATGTTSGIAITEAADTTNACYSLTFTPPTGNTHVWHVSASVTWERTD